jgi:hypothetical protein
MCVLSLCIVCCVELGLLNSLFMYSKLFPLNKIHVHMCFQKKHR